MSNEKIEYKGYFIEIIPDENASNPRTEWDNFGHMVCSHKRYDLGDTEKYEVGKPAPIDFDEFNSWDEVAEHLRKVRKAIIILPLYLYDHSGITMSTGSFNDRWDSRQVGFIYCTKEDILKNWGVKSVHTKVKYGKGGKIEALKYAEELLRGEVETYDDYLTGNVYGFNVTDADGEDIADGSVWGYYGDPEKSGLMEEAKSSIEWEIKHRKEQAENEIEEAKKIDSIMHI